MAVEDESEKQPKGAPLTSPTETSSKKAFDEAFYVKLGPNPAFPKG